MEAQPEFELSIANQAKPFPLGPLAVATFINSKSDDKAPISIICKPVPCFDDKNSGSTAKLVRTKEYLYPTFQHFSPFSQMNYTGNDFICKALAEAFPSAKLWTADLSDTLETMILRTTNDLSSSDKANIVAALEAINQSMTFSMHPIGHFFTVGDFTLWAAIRNSPSILAEVQVKDKYPEIQQWYEEYMEKQPFIQQVFKTMNTMTKEPAVFNPHPASHNGLSIRNPSHPRMLASSSKVPNKARLSSVSLPRYLHFVLAMLIS